MPHHFSLQHLPSSPQNPSDRVEYTVIGHKWSLWVDRAYELKESTEMYARAMRALENGVSMSTQTPTRSLSDEYTARGRPNGCNEFLSWCRKTERRAMILYWVVMLIRFLSL